MATIMTDFQISVDLESCCKTVIQRYNVKVFQCEKNYLNTAITVSQKNYLRVAPESLCQHIHIFANTFDLKTDVDIDNVF